MRQKIESYLRQLNPRVLGLDSMEHVHVGEMIAGDYNLNFRVEIPPKKFIFRINIQPQSGLKNQIEYEYRVLKFLENKQIAPKAYCCDTTKNRFNFDILIEEYLDGNYLDYEKKSLREMARLLATLHTVPIEKESFFVRWKNPLQCNYESVAGELQDYGKRKTSDGKIVSLGRTLLREFEKTMVKDAPLFTANSITHTDTVCDNFIKTGEGMRIIDWEKPRVDDCSYDICCVLSEPAELWSSERTLTEEERNFFIESYCHFKGDNPSQLMEKVRTRIPLISLHWVLWAAGRLCDVKENKIPKELMIQQKDVSRYEKVATPEHIAKFL